jgi:D-alanyl-lipoteichoic acid acyltransferase DltB (MBOAT superfamily)
MSLGNLSLDTASFEFVLFGLIAALASNVGRSRVWRSAVLLCMSFVFLFSLARGITLLWPIAAFLLLGFCGLLAIGRDFRNAAIMSVSAVIMAYIWLKKYTFLPKELFLNSPYLTVGVSYIFFRVLHLLIEAGDRREHRRIGAGAYLLYTTNFTTLVSGPIQPYDEFARDQFAAEPLPLGPRVIGLQLERLIRGFFKVNVLGVLLLSFHHDALARVSQPLPMELKIFSAAEIGALYPFFLYANFSGYIDIVMALARLMRLRLPENFDRPFSASSFLDFWNRWHITLSTWFKHYVYNPLLLALMRRISSPTLQPLLGVVCFFVTFFLVGIWHGRTSEFVVFGVLQGGGISLNKLWQLGLGRLMGRKGYQTLAHNPLYEAFGRGLTFSWFAFTLSWLWADWSEIDLVFRAIGAVRWLGVWLAIWLLATVFLGLWERLRSALLSIRTAEGPVLASRYARMVYASALGLVAFVMTVLLNQPAPGIVYKAF